MNIYQYKKLQFKFKRIFNKFFIKRYNGQVNTNGVIVLGRGQSLNHFNKESSSIDANLVIICNCEGHDIRKSNIKKCLFGRVCVFLTNICEVVPSFLDLFRLTVSNVFVCRFDPKNSNGISLLTQKRMFEHLDCIIGSTSYLPDCMDDIFCHKYSGGTGTLGILLALRYYKAKNLYLFGFDFYETGYFYYNINEMSPMEDQEAGKKLKSNFLRIVEAHPDTKFYLYTNSTLSSSLPNLSIFHFNQK